MHTAHLIMHIKSIIVVKMRLLIVRHGQTTNNVLMAEIYARRDRGEISAQQAEEEWLAKRVDDPPITETVRAIHKTPRNLCHSGPCHCHSETEKRQSLSTLHALQQSVCDFVRLGAVPQGIEEAEQLGSFYSQVFKATGSRLRISEPRYPVSHALCTRLTPNATTVLDCSAEPVLPHLPDLPPPGEGAGTTGACRSPS